MPDHVLGLWYIAAAIAYPIAVLLAERRRLTWGEGAGKWARPLATKGLP